jgi:glycosyltransferase involved in cell wall biosynthesis
MIKVSVIVHTYKHENYIRQTLDSIVNQQVNFEYEVIVGDDASPDSTPDIIREYQQKYPHLIKPLLHPVNLGGFGKNNTMATLAEAKGNILHQWMAMIIGQVLINYKNRLIFWMLILILSLVFTML